MNYLGVPIKVDPGVPDEWAILRSEIRSGPGTADPSFECGVMIRPDGVLVEYVIRDGKMETR